jgi:hypothetical protein
MSNGGRELARKDRETVQLLLRYEGMRRGYDGPARQGELAEALHYSPISMTYLKKGQREFPEIRLVWAIKLYEKFGLTWEELGKAIESDFSKAEIKARLRDS